MKKKVIYNGFGDITHIIDCNITSKRQSLLNLIESNSKGEDSIVWKPVIIEPDQEYNSTKSAIKELALSQYSDKSPFSLTNTFSNFKDKEIYGAGCNWFDKNKKNVILTLTNSNSDEFRCIRFRPLFDGIFEFESTGYYEPKSLNTVVSIDEDDKRKICFYNSDGKIILSRVEDFDTYYIYDDFSNLLFVIQPKYSKLLSANKKYSKNIDLDNFCFQYKYDEYNRCIAKKLPGAEWVYMVYDKTDMLTYYQDGNLRKKNAWKYFVYDRFDRIAIEGIITRESRSHADLCTAIAEQSCRTVYGTDGALWGYDSKLNYADKASVKKMYFYDSYNFIGESDFSSKSQSLDFVKENDYDERYVADIPEISAKGMLTGMLVMEENDPKKRSLSAIYYNYKGEAIQTRMVDQDEYATVVNNLYTFTGTLLKTKSDRKSLTSSQTGDLTEEYIYDLDHAERVKKISRNGIELISYNYDELGRVESHLLHGKESVSFKYNIRDWVTEIKSPDFDQQLFYEKKPNDKEGYYNGNISFMKNNSPVLEVDYSLEYDNLNRNTYCFGYDLKNDRADCFSEYITYDANTNPTDILRSNDQGSWTDVLTMSYNGNQLNSVFDEYGAQYNPDIMEFNEMHGEKNMYAYDANGNLVKDKHRKISKISYNSLNLPDTIQFSNGNQIINRYLADGTKLSAKYLTYPVNIVLPDDTIVKVEEDPRTTITDYFYGNLQVTSRGFKGLFRKILTPIGYITYLPNELKSGNGNVSLTNEDDVLLSEIDSITDVKTMGHQDSMSLRMPPPPPRPYPLYCYYIKDYQGNNRKVIGFNESGTARVVVQSTDYYPSGTLVQTSTEQWEQPYKYNGKELIRMHGLDWYDYGARYYEPVLSRFTTMDPLAEKYYSISPYAYCAGNPVMFVDPDGRNRKPVINEKKKTITIVATYYYNYETEHLTKSAVNYWNNIKTHTYTNEHGVKYRVKYQLSASYASYPESLADKNEIANSIIISNEIKTTRDGQVISGWTNGKNIKISRSSPDPKFAVIHEIGHTLGAALPGTNGEDNHSERGLMVPALNSSNKSYDVDQKSINGIIEKGRGPTEYMQPDFWERIKDTMKEIRWNFDMKFRR